MNWWHWHTEPELIGGILLVIWLYAVFTGPLRSRLTDAPYPWVSAITFYSALILFYLTVGSPLDYVGEVYLFSIHMVQHILLMYAVSILLILGLPDWLTRPLFEKPWIQKSFGFFRRPAVAGVIFVATFSAWHIPPLYEASLQSRLIHNFEHITMFGTAFFVWWNFFSQSKRMPPIEYGAQILYIFVLSLATIPVASYLVFSNEVLYPTYEFAPRITDLSAFDDQVLGGVLKTLVAKFFGLILIGYSFYRWSQEGERNEALSNEPEHLPRVAVLESGE